MVDRPCLDILKSLTVLDLGTGMAPALVTKLMREMGARVIRLEPATGDPFYDVYPAYKIWRQGAAVERLESLAHERVRELLASVDLCVVGGEDHPDLDWRLAPDALTERYERLIVLDISAYPASHEAHGRPGTELLVEARSGLAFEHYTDRPLVYGFAGANYGAALQGAFGALAALVTRSAASPARPEARVVRTSLWEGALFWCLPFWFTGETPDAGFNFEIPKNPRPLIFECADGVHIHFVLGSVGSKGRLWRILKIDDPDVGPNDTGSPSPATGAKNYYGPIDLLAAHVKNFTSTELLSAIREAEVAVEPSLPPGAAWSDPQVEFHGIIKAGDDGVRHVGLPFTAARSVSGRTLERLAPEPGKPMAGLRALDFGAFVAGPLTVAPLVDLGTEVIKIEPLTGDPLRMTPRSFMSVSRGKKSIAVNMKAREGAEIVRRLCQTADVVENNFRPGVSERLGVDPAAIHAANPGAIVVEATGYGSKGPSGSRPGFDMVIQALCGFEVSGGGEGNPPLWSRSAMIDYASGMVGAISIMVGLLRRQQTGDGSKIETCLLDTGLFLGSEYIQGADGTFEGGRRLNKDQTGFHPAQSLYATCDGWIAIDARTDGMCAALVQVLGMTGQWPERRADWGQGESARLTDAIGNREGLELLAALERAGIWAEPVIERGGEVLERPEAEAEGTVSVWRSEVFGEVRQLGQLFRWRAVSTPVSTPCPGLGAHTRPILSQLGYSEADIDRFYAERIVA